jgi:hypothetical protein
MIQVDWSQVELRPRGYRSRPNKRESYYACTCEQCGRTYWLRATDARRAEQRGSTCKRCHCQVAGRNGYAATRDKYGVHYALERVAAYQLAHPSKPEDTVRNWLEERGLHYSRQYIFRKGGANFIIDFVIFIGVAFAMDQRIALEVNGYHHQKHGQARDARLQEMWPGAVVFIDATRVTNAPAEAQAELFARLAGV